MTENLKNWLKENKMTASKLEMNGLDAVEISGVGKFLYIHPNDEGKIIDSDFSFILSDEEFDALDEKLFDYILFEFGGKFYYLSIKVDKNRYNEIIYKPEFNDFKYLGVCAEEPIMDFVHLGVHDEYEMLSGSGNCELWCKKAKFLGHKAIGVCDKNSLASSLSFQSAAEKLGLKSIIGETIVVAVNYNSEEKIQETYELKVYVLSQEGWHNLLMINKTINVDYEGYIPDTVLLNYGRGLACVIAKNSYFNHLVSNKDISKACKLLKVYNKVFDYVYYQIDTLEYESSSLFKEHLSNIDNYIRFFRKLVKPIVINDSFYLDKEEHELKGFLHKISGKAAPEAKDQYYKSALDTLSSYQEWLDVKPLYDVIVKGITNTVKLCDTVNFKINNTERKIPKFEVEDPEGMFFNELQKGINKKLVGKVDDIDKYLQRIQTECELIVPNDLCSYFLILWDICNWCREKNIMIGPGRGSVCGSLVAYCLNITQVDPLKYQLYFERFLNAQRVSAHHAYTLVFNDGSEITYRDGDKVKLNDGSEIEASVDVNWKDLNLGVKNVRETTFYTDLPDVDTDYETFGRDLVKEYIKDKYGKAYSCSVGTYTRMKLKTCIKDFAKVKGLSFDYTNRVTKDIDDQIEYTFTDLIEYATKSKTLFKFVQDYPEIVHMTKYSLSSCKAASVHPSAVIIVPKISQETGKKMDIYEWMPIKTIDGILVSEWEGKYTEASLFLKEDVLGLSQLDKFHNMLNLIEKNKHVKIDVNTIPFDDEQVFRFFRKGWCEDVFQFGTMSLMNYCKQVKPTEFSDLVAMTALFRPGPIQSNAHNDFADIKNGKKKPKYDFGVENITSETYSLLVYQEQMMSIIHQLGGLSLIEAENARKYIKKKKHKELAALGDAFIAGAISKGCPENEARKIWDKMNAFSSYSFNKSHAVAYTLMSYWSQWFKVNYPLEFWTTSLQFAAEADIPYRLSEMKKIGVDFEIRQPDVNYSESNFTCDSENNRIFYSLVKIKGVGEIAAQNIIETRKKGGQFFSLEEFVDRVPSKVNKTNIKLLIISGAFDLIEDIEQPRDRRKLLEKYLIEIKGEKELPKEYNTEEAKISNSFWILEQKRLTGFGEINYQNMLPNKRMKNIFVDDSEFFIARDNTEVCVAGKFLSFTEREIKNGLMCSLQIDCNNTVISITMWPSEYSHVLRDVGGDMLAIKGKVICISGTVKKDKFRNQKMLFSNTSTKLYVIS